MLNQRDVDYLLMRETEERLQAASCADPSIAAIHFDLAERYADAAWSAEEASALPVRPSGLWSQRAATVRPL